MEEPRGPLISSPAVARVARWGLVAWAVIGVAVVAYLAFRFVIYPIRIVFPPLLVALIIVFLLNPIVSRLQRRGIPRLWGTLLSYVVFLTGAGIGLAYLIPLVSQQVAAFDLQQLVAKATDALADLGRRIGFDVSGASLVGREEAAGFLARITEITSGVLHVVLIFVLGPIIAFYLLLDLPKITAGVQAAIPARRRAEAHVLAARLSAALGGFFRGQLLVALFVGVASMLALYVVGLPFWALVGLLTGLFNLIPLIGPFIGGILAVLIAFTVDAPAAGFILHPEPGLPLAVASAVALLLVQQVDNHIMSPNIVARTVKLHPVTVMLSLLAGGTLMGLWGMLLAVPVVASAKILLVHYWDTRSSWPPGAPTRADAAGKAAAEAAEGEAAAGDREHPGAEGDAGPAPGQAPPPPDAERWWRRLFNGRLRPRAGRGGEAGERAPASGR